ncbi:unnamed protein product, partial [Prunus brigantina]
SPHTPEHPTPRMGPVNTPENPTPCVTSHLISPNLPIRRNIQHHVWGSNYPKLGQVGPRGPRPPNSDPKVPMSSTRLSNGSHLSNLDNAQYAISVRDSNVSKLKSEHIYVLVMAKRSPRHNAPFLQCPRAATRAESAWVSKAIPHYWENSKSQLKTPTL